MSKWIIAAGVAALALAGCTEAPESDQTVQPAEPVVEDGGNLVATNVQAAMFEMGESERNVVFIRAIRDAGLQCQNVTASERVDDVQNLPTWRATCQDGTAHLISITVDGTANIISRTDT
ncbi:MULTISPECIES: hypothetical protein [unclassified Sphingosinithalassobacter]|uniref:hypothetical protein n=1 Tax=unclassified Sphingosinithalassobacter TaxID=2676235 RepID=UPI00165D5CFF|nr:hypothetical protein [Sphingosinithalassobacter sp. CS137]